MPARGAVRLASDSDPAAGRSTQPDRSVPYDPLPQSMTIPPAELFDTKLTPFSTSGLPGGTSFIQVRHLDMKFYVKGDDSLPLDW